MLCCAVIIKIILIDNTLKIWVSNYCEALGYFTQKPSLNNINYSEKYVRKACPLTGDYSIWT